MADKLIVDCSTGERTTAPWTDEDESSRPVAVPDPPDRVAALEARIDAAAALAEQANATAQDVAQAMKPTR